MPSILPDFEYDIFISYRHNDNRSGWVTEFVNALQEELAATIKEPLSIYFDKNPHDGLLETHHVDKSLEGKLKCLIFIPIISQTYCDTKSFAWQHEFVAFNKLAQEDELGRDIKLGNGNVASRILPIKIHELDADDTTTIENEIGGVLRAIEFIYKSGGVNRPLNSKDDEIRTPSKILYRDQVNKVANAVKEIITALKNPVDKTSSYPKRNKPTSSTPSQKKSIRKIIFVSTAIIILFAVIYATYDLRNSINKKPEVLDKSIAVLPFVNMSVDPDQEYFSDGLSEELINLLAKIPDLKVIARTSSFSFKGKNEDIRAIGKKLGVGQILEGSVRKSGNKIRITAQLIRTHDGSHIWSETFDREIDDVFAIQAEISKTVVSQLESRMSEQPIRVVAHSTSPVYNLYLQGNYYFEKRDKESVSKAILFYQQALTLDSLDGRLWGALAKAYSYQADWGWINHNIGFQKARVTANKSIALSPLQAEGHRVLGEILTYYDYNWTQAKQEFLKAQQIEPGNAEILVNLALLARIQGDLNEAIDLCKQSIELDPIKAMNYYILGVNQMYTNQLDEAIDSFNKSLELNQQFAAAHTFLGITHILRGENEIALEQISQESDEAYKIFGMALVYHSLRNKNKADEELEKLIREFQHDWMYSIAKIYAFRGEKDNAFLWLEKAYEGRDSGIPGIKGDPLLKNLYNDSRYLQTLKKLNLSISK